MSSVSYGQDLLIRNDSTRQEVKVLEINPTQIKYKRFNYPDGPLFIIEKQEVFMIIYQNGVKEMFKQEQPPLPKVSLPDTIIARPIYALEKREPFWRISFYSGMVVNGSYSNKPYTDSPENAGLGPSAAGYSRPGKEYYKTGFSLGVNFLAGRSEYFKTIIGIQYVQSNAEYNYNTSYIDINKSNPYTTYSGRTELNYHNTSHFINVVGGFRFRILKGLSLDPCLSLNMNAYSKSNVNGLITSVNGPDPTTYHVVKDSAATFTEAHVTLSFMPKVAYEFKIKEQRVGVYVSYNMALQYRLPWWMFGVTWYPFKKLS